MAEWSLIEARPDWLTAVATNDEQPERLLKAGLEIIEEEARNGQDKRPWHFSGYRGVATRHVAAGWRADGAIVRLGGAQAAVHWVPVSAVAGRVTRVDVAVTAQSTPETVGYARECDTLCRRATPKRGKPSVFTLLDNSLGGQTLYCGRRSSQRFGRLYRKDIEAPKEYPAVSWRWEVEYKGDSSKAVALLLGSITNGQVECRQIVGDQFQRWGAALPQGIAGVAEPIRWPAVPPTDAAGRLAWIGSAARSAIRKSLEAFRAEDVLRALGIDDIVEVKSQFRSEGVIT